MRLNCKSLNYQALIALGVCSENRCEAMTEEGRVFVCAMQPFRASFGRACTEGAPFAPKMEFGHLCEHAPL